jgi:hypothetical protein
VVVSVTAAVVVTVPLAFSVAFVGESWVEFVVTPGEESPPPQPPTISRAPRIAAVPKIVPKFTHFFAFLFIFSSMYLVCLTSLHKKTLSRANPSVMIASEVYRIKKYFPFANKIFSRDDICYE